MHLSTLLVIVAMLVPTVLSGLAFPRPPKVSPRDIICANDPVLQALYDNSADASAFCSCFVAGSTLYTSVAAPTVTNVLVVSTETPIVTVFGGHATTSAASATAIPRRQVYERYCCETIPTYLESCSVSTQQISSACSCLITVSAIDTQTITVGDVTTVEISSTLTLPTVTIYQDAGPSTSIPLPSVTASLAGTTESSVFSSASKATSSSSAAEISLNSSASETLISSSQAAMSSIGSTLVESSSSLPSPTTPTSLASASQPSSTEPTTTSSPTIESSTNTPTTVDTEIATTLLSSGSSVELGPMTRTRQTAAPTATIIPPGCSAPLIGCVFGMTVIATFSITDPTQCQPLCLANSTCMAYQIGTDQTTSLTTFCELLNVSAFNAWDVTGSGVNNLYCSHFFCYDRDCPWLSGFPFFILQ